MNSNFILLVIFVGVFVFMAFLSDRRRKKKKIIFFGDSITQAGVQRKGYISVMKEMLRQQGIENYELAGAGIGGNKVYDLYLRMEEDVLNRSPDIVVIYAGVNDVWHKKLLGEATDAENFEKIYRAIITKFSTNEIKVIVCTPAIIGEKNDFTNELDVDLNNCSNIIRNIAADIGLPIVDLHKAFHEYELVNNIDNVEKGILTTDGVHLSDKGNELAAELMLMVIKEME